MRVCANVLIVLCFLVTGFAGYVQADVELYVSPDGNDEWSGGFADPNAQNTDGPFATLEKARETVRNLSESGDVTVYLREGVYSRSETLVLSSEDSGNGTSRVTWCSYPGETAHIVGGVFINNFEEISDEAILNRLYENARDHVLQADLKALGLKTFNGISQQDGPGMALYFETQPMTLSRYPNDGWLTIFDVPLTCEEPIQGDVRTGGYHCGHFLYTDPDADPEDQLQLPEWQFNDNMWMFGYWYFDWSSMYQKIEQIDYDAKDIVVTPPYHYYGYRDGHRYFFLNILEEVDSPGEWYLDFDTGILYFWPPGPIDENDVFISSMSTVMLQCSGASNITIKDMLIEGTQGSAVQVEESDNVIVDGCEIRNVNGDYAIEIDSGTENGAMNCHIYNVGGGGVKLSGGDRATLTSSDSYAINNLIHDFGLVYRTYHGGVNVSGVGNTVAHNEIYNAPHLGMSFSGNEHIIEYNEIHSVAQETHDVGAIYNGRDWTQRGTVIRYNYIHDNEYAEAVYFDDFLSGNIVYGNVIYNNKLGILIGGGRDNIVENNMFIDNGSNIHVDGRGIGWASNYFDTTHSNYQSTLFDRMDAMQYQEPPYSERYPELLTLYDDEPALPKNNVFNRNILYGDSNWSIHNDVDYLIISNGNFEDADPHFIDYQGQNFQLADDSPVYSEIGFERVPFEEMGLLKNIPSTSIKSELPIPVELDQNTPNPFNPTTLISFSLPEPVETNLTVYNALGQEVGSLVHERLNAGNHAVVFDGGDLSSGIYFYRLQCGDTVVSRKMLLMK